MALQKNSPYKVFMKHAIVQLSETGQMAQIRSRFISTPPDCQSGIVTVQALGVHKLIFLFIILAVGSFLSVWIFAWEMCYSGKKRDTFERHIKKLKHESKNAEDATIALNIEVAKLVEDLYHTVDNNQLDKCCDAIAKIWVVKKHIDTLNNFVQQQ